MCLKLFTYRKCPSAMSLLGAEGRGWAYCKVGVNFKKCLDAIKSAKILSYAFGFFNSIKTLQAKAFFVFYVIWFYFSSIFYDEFSHL